MLNNEFPQNINGEEILDHIDGKDDSESKEVLEKESITESIEDVEYFAKEKIDDLSLATKENIETNEAEKVAILNLDGDLNELGNLTSDVDSEIQNIIKIATEDIVKWLKLNNPNFNEDNFYRIIDENGYRDFVDNKVVRSSPTGTRSNVVGNFDMGHRPTPFPSFAKGTPDLNYAKKGEENYILESDTLMYRKGDINPVTGHEIKSGHWAYRPLNEDGSWKTKMNPEEIKNIYKIDKDGNIYIKDSPAKEKDTSDDTKN